ncbi:MAG: glycosyltransferase family 2 protein [Solirubrobacteraceae bacterium]
MSSGPGAAESGADGNGGAGVDVAVVAYRRWDLTRSCLEHLARQTLPHRVTVCDNGCDEHTAEQVAAEFPAAQIVRLDANMPYPIACNRAVAAGDAEFVVMMNNDVDARSDFIERLVAPLRSDPALGSVSSLLLRPGGKMIDSAGLVADATLAGFPRFQGHPSHDAQATQPILTGPAGAAAAFRRRAWEQVGGLDTGIPAYMEDLDLALRLRHAGWSAALALDAVAVHLGSATFGHRSAAQRRRAGFARGYMVRRYRVLRSRAAARTLVTEAIVIAGDLALSRDAAALRGRLSGWRAAGGLPRRPSPPQAAIDGEITFLDSLRLRRAAYRAA